MDARHPVDPAPAHRVRLDAVREALGVIPPEFRDTPQYRCEPLDAALGAAVTLKVETNNPIRCFKGRGASVLLASLTGAEPVVTASAGNWGQAIAYAQSNWAALNRYLDEGYLAIDNNAAERALRPVAVGRKNWLFAGSADAGRRAAVLMTLVSTCKLQGINPETYLADVLVRVSTTPMSRIDELTPRGWKKARDLAG